MWLSDKFFTNLTKCVAQNYCKLGSREKISIKLQKFNVKILNNIKEFLEEYWRRGKI